MHFLKSDTNVADELGFKVQNLQVLYDFAIFFSIFLDKQ